MKIAYLFPNSFVEKSANRIQATNFGYALIKESNVSEVKFITADNYTVENLNKLGIKQKSTHHIELRLSFKRFKTLQFILKLLQLRLIEKETVIYVRDYPIIKILYYLRTLFKTNKIIIELHEVPEKDLLKYITIADKYVAISNTIKTDLLNILNIRANDILVAHDGYTNLIKIDSNTKSIDKILKIIDCKTIVYIGTYQKWKNIEFIMEIAKKLPAIKFLLIGIDKDKIQNYDINLLNVIFVDYIDHQYIPIVLNKAKYAIYTLNINYSISKYTSPLKLFEYLHYGLTIFAPNYESITEVLTDNHNAYLYDIKNIETSVELIEKTIKNGSLLNENIVKLSANEYNWNNRARKVLHFVEN